MIGAEIRRFSSDRRGLTLNVVLGVVGGALAALAETLVLPIIVLPFFVGNLAASYATVGLVPAIGIGLWSLARIPAAILVGPQRSKLPWAIAACLVRAAAIALLAFVSFRSDPEQTLVEPDPLLRSFFICYVAYSLAAGFASVPTAAVLAKAIPHEGRALFYRQRALWGGVASLVAGLVILQLLGGGPPFPHNFALLFLAATVAQTATAFFVATLREPARVAEPRQALLGGLRAAPETLADPNFRRYLIFRVFLSLTALLDPFLIIFAVSKLELPAVAVGGYVVAYVAGRLLATPVWVGLARRHGEKALLQTAALLRLLPPLLALLLPYLTTTAFYRDRLGERGPVAVWFGAAFVALGAVNAAQSRGNFGYLAELAPIRLRAAYAGVTNGLLAIVAFAPLAGGILLDRLGFDALFLTASLVGLLAVFASGSLTDTHVRTRTTAAWRLRRATAPTSPVPRPPDPLPSAGDRR